MNLYLVACVSMKLTAPAAAEDLYVSPWFRKAAELARRRADSWYILSALHGLVAPWETVAPYNQTLVATPAARRREWARAVLAKLLGPFRVGAGDRVMFLAGRRYREHLVEPLEAAGVEVDVPMAGLGIGEQLRWLTQQLGEGR